MIKVNRRFRRSFGKLRCEWCNEYTRVWVGVSINSKTIKLWKDDYLSRVYQCRKPRCLSSRPEDWAEIKTLIEPTKKKK